MERVLTIVRLGRAAREKVQIKVRQPVARMWIFPLEDAALDLDADLLGQIAGELNVKDVRSDGDRAQQVRPELKLNFAALGSKLGPAMKEVTKAAREGNWKISPAGTLAIAGQELTAGEYDLQFAGVENRAAAQDHGVLVVIDTELTDALRLEGYAREVIRSVQDLRKQAGYNVEDRIVLSYDSSDPLVRELFSTHGDYIGEETLCREIQPQRGEADQSDELALEKACKVWLGVKR